MPAYHSKLCDNGVAYVEACGCAICPLHTDVRGPADSITVEEEDIIDETLHYFRANVMFRNFDVRGGPDKTMIYLTLFAHACLVKCERIDDKNQAIKDLRAMATKQFAIPGEAGWPLGGLFAAPVDRKEGDLFRAFFKQAREELAMRIVHKIYNSSGVKDKWWQSFSKRKFMGKELRE